MCRDYLLIIGFSAGELLHLSPGRLKAEWSDVPPGRQLYNDNGSDSEEELSVQDSHFTVLCSLDSSQFEQIILEAFKSNSPRARMVN
ncbi:hypothetical protein PGT21_036746 [Puccinia graminis f. sp. tritici]|uniref:Uncharacterized protein n=1 Tax=Puccinia graminis f. sp. tritici TaxID=56615 RepID=A0A5B0R368_PUCGR|nr:hypothetical protein PGT21_036746 [Puccinia graminis f. sp. tritici]